MTALVSVMAATSLLACSLKALDRGAGRARGATNETPSVEETSEPGDDDVGDEEATGVPCDVASLIENRCVSCHDSLLSAPMTILSYDDLVAEAPSSPGLTVAEAALERMTNDDDPMPPRPPRATTAEIEAFRAWLEAGLPRGTCEITP